MASKKELLTIEEVSEMFGYPISSLKTNFNRTAASIKKKYNIDLYKIKEGGTIYYIPFKEERALSIYDEVKDISISTESLSFEAFEFFVFLALAASNQSVYRGTRENLLKYMELPISKKNLSDLDLVLKKLEERKIIKVDRGKQIIVAYITEELETEMPIRISMLRECRKIAEDNNKQLKKISQLIQVWQAIRLCEKNQPFTYAELQKQTGLSYKQIRDVKKLLESNDIFKTNRAGSYWACLGMNVDLNAFYDNDNVVDS